MVTTYRAAKKSEVETMAVIVAEAFMDYPLYQPLRKIINNEKKYARFMVDMQRTLIKAHIKKKDCFVGLVDEEIISFIILEKPKSKVSFFRYLSVGGLKLGTYSCITTMLSFFNYLDRAWNACNKTKKTAWFVVQVAVSKLYQGKQFGSKLFQEFVYPYIRANGGKMLTLSTNTESNYRFYIKNGFTEFDNTPLHWKGNTVENRSFKIAL